ncbi:hypothetical protein [Zobellia galactanivorans]|uniref:Hypothetical periplasmic protein n=1 Tax=Zobellia galactanivorans (strain DSM 12802 / CCUG 47099 / CIP 106680 / NCIMB 13871 / Dsij) TaxID=63186 RepID=G0L0J2_ZOBGA|nr:hypothetical protein [Zobellia galactanivorans]CAZ97434.1 Hypothetical periplasmic protein [Zobellia galactanivorans]
MRWIILVMFFPISLMSQTVDRSIANSVCETLSSLNFSEDPDTLHDSLITSLKAEYKNHRPAFIDQILAYEKDSLISQMQAAQVIGEKTIVHLMDNCIPFQRITMFESQAVPEISQTAKKLGKKFTALLLRKAESQDIDNDLIDATRLEIREEYAGLIAKKYGDSHSKVFMKEFDSYIMTESLPYMKWAASNFN